MISSLDLLDAQESARLVRVSAAPVDLFSHFVRMAGDRADILQGNVQSGIAERISLQKRLRFAIAAYDVTAAESLIENLIAAASAVYLSRAAAAELERWLTEVRAYAAGLLYDLADGSQAIAALDQVRAQVAETQSCCVEAA